jgi:hypothetical protein
MLQTLLLVVFVSAITIIFGLSLLLFFKKESILIINEQQLVLAFFSGLTFIVLISSWLSLIAPLNIICFSPFVLIAVINLLYKRKYIQWKNDLKLKDNKYEVAFFIIACTLFFQLGSLEPYMADTEIYHIQIVRWYQQFTTVPGLANLYPRFGFYSNWFHLISTLSFSPDQGNLLYLNTTISIWFTFFLLTKIASFKKNNISDYHFFRTLYTIILLFMFLGWNMLRGNCRSMGNDFIVTLLVLYILFHIAEIRLVKVSEQIPIKVFIILAISIPFFKLTGSFILLILLLYFIQTKQPLKIYGYTAAILALFILPFFTKNYIQTGYLFYPYTFLDLFSPDWKLPLPFVHRFQEFITLSNKYIYEDVPTEAWGSSSFKWLNTWFLKLALYDKVLLVLFLVSIPCLIFYHRLINQHFRRITIYLLAILPVVIVWLFISPDPRFLYGFILFNTFYILTFVLLLFNKASVHNISYKLTFWVIFLFAFYKISLYDGPLLSASFPEKPPYKKVEINYNTFYLAQKKTASELLKCVDLPIPCIYSINPYLQMRSSRLEDGFKINTTVDSVFISNYIY